MDNVLNAGLSGRAAHLRQAGVYQDALIGEAHQRRAALGAPRLRRGDGTGRLPATWRQRRLVLHQPEHRPA